MIYYLVSRSNLVWNSPIICFEGQMKEKYIHLPTTAPDKTNYWARQNVLRFLLIKLHFTLFFCAVLGFRKTKVGLCYLDRKWFLLYYGTTWQSMLFWKCLPINYRRKRFTVFVFSKIHKGKNRDWRIIKILHSSMRLQHMAQRHTFT